MKYGNNLNFEVDQIEKSVNNLFIFLNDNILNNKKIMDKIIKIVINGIYLPPLNNKDMKDILYHHFMKGGDLTKQYLDKNLILPQHEETTKIAVMFNKKLKQKCNQCDEIMFVEIASKLIDKNTEIVDQKYVKTDTEKSDIHLNFKSLIPIYHKDLKQLNIKFAMEIDSIWDKLKLSEKKSTRDELFDVIVCDLQGVYI